MYAGDTRASRGKRQICELLRKQNGGHFCEKVALFSVDTTFKNIFLKNTSGLDTPMRSSPLSCQMIGASFWSRALCRYDEPFGHNLIFKSHFRIFFRPPLQTWRRGDTFRKWLVIGIGNRRRREHGDTIFCNKILVTSSGNLFNSTLRGKVPILGGKSFFFAPLCYATAFRLQILEQYSTGSIRQKKPEVDRTINKGTLYPRIDHNLYICEISRKVCTSQDG